MGVLILIVVEDGFVLEVQILKNMHAIVLILIVEEDGLVQQPVKQQFRGNWS